MISVFPQKPIINHLYHGYFPILLNKFATCSARSPLSRRRAPWIFFFLMTVPQEILSERLARTKVLYCSINEACVKPHYWIAEMLLFINY